MKVWKTSENLFLAVLTAILLLTACASVLKGEENAESSTSDAASADTANPGESELNGDMADSEAEKGDLPRQSKENVETEQGTAYDDVEPWQKAYIAVLNTVRAQNVGDHFGIDDTSYTHDDGTLYQLYDIDKDNIPELFIKYGITSIGSRVHIYTIRDDTAVQIGREMYTVHGGLYTWPNENGVMFNYGHMGAAGASRWTLVNGKINSETILEEYVDNDSPYTDVQTIVPGTQSIDSFSIDIDLPILRYQQIRADQENRLPITPGTADNAAVKQTLLNVIKSNGMVHGAVSDPFGSGTGYMAFQDYLGPGMVDEYANYPLSVSRYAWADVNGDGQLDCVLHLVPDEQDSWLGDTYAVMSLQGDEVYVYSWSYFMGIVLEDGVFASGSYGDSDTPAYTERLLFDGEECFQYSVESRLGVGEVAWETLAG